MPPVDPKQIMRNVVATMASLKAAYVSILPGNRAAITAALRERHITFVLVEFDGADDSGAMMDAKYSADELPAREEWMAKLVTPNWGADPGTNDVRIIKVREDRGVRTVQAFEPLPTAVMTFAWQFLEAHHPGWENNGGATGSIWIDARHDRAGLDISCRVVAYEDFDYEV